MDKGSGVSIYASRTADVRVPFAFYVIHGDDPSRRSSIQKASTRSINLVGLVFETPQIEVESFHLSFTEASFSRNAIEIHLDLGKKYDKVELLAQVEWYERRSPDAFIVGVNFVDIPADALEALRELLKKVRLSGGPKSK